MRWEAKGTSWPLTDPDTGLFLMPGIRGLGSARSERHSTRSPATPGSRHEGVSFLDREVFWPVCIWNDDGSVDWMLRDRAFWSTMDPLVPGLWVVTLPDGSERSLQIRFTDDGDHVSEYDPIRRGWEKYGIKLLAEQPFWEGQPVVRAWKNRTYEPFFEPVGPHIVNIASGSDASTATIDNPGDVESYARWFIDGDTTTAAVGVDGVTVEVPFSIAAWECLVIESDPDLIGATLYDVTPEGAELKPSERVVGEHLINPVDKTPDLGEADFAPIPPGESVPLSLTINGSGAVELLLPTLYRRAW
jgi:hypothetical protein